MAPAGIEDQSQLKNIPLPPELKCSECHKFKPTVQFSNKQLNELRYKIASGFSVDANAPNIRCRLCTDNQVHELPCSGPCRSMRSLDAFSKCQRKMPDGAWCLACVQWKEAMEPGLTTLPPPNNNLSPDEEQILQLNEAQHYVVGPEGEQESDYEEDHFYSSLPALVLESKTPLARDRNLQNNTREAEGKSRNTKSSPSNLFMQSSNSGNDKVDSSQPNSDDANIRKPALYYPWDNHVPKQSRIRTTDSSDPKVTTQKASDKTTGRRGGWAKVRGQRRAAPEFIVTRPTTGNEVELDSEDEGSESDIRNVY